MLVTETRVRANIFMIGGSEEETDNSPKLLDPDIKNPSQLSAFDPDFRQAPMRSINGVEEERKTPTA